MRAGRNVPFFASLAGVLLVTGGAGAAAPLEPLAAECVAQSSYAELDACPNGPQGFDVTKKRSAAYKSAAPTQEKKKKVTELSAADPAAKFDANELREERQSRLQARARALLTREIQGLEKLYQRTSEKHSDKGKLARRLAEAYVELESAANRDRIQAVIKQQDLGPKGKPEVIQKAKAEEKAAAKVSDLARKKAITYYTWVKDNVPQYPKLDEVLYYLAFEYELDGNIDKARSIYWELIQKSPQSSYIPNAYLAFGELFFQEAQANPDVWATAGEAYREVKKYPAPGNKVWGYAAYKLGYTYWNLNEYDKALQQFKEVVEFGRQFPELPNAKKLGESAERDIIPVYAIAGRASKAYGFLRKVSGEEGDKNTRTFELMNDLGLAYLDTGHYDEAVVLFHDLMSRDKGDKFCYYQTQVTKAVQAEKSGDKAAVRQELDRQLQVYKQFGGESHSAAAKDECANDTAGALTETAMAWHLEAVGTGGTRGTGDKKTMDLAAYLYKQVTESFTGEQFATFKFPRIAESDWPNLFKIRYAMADLLYFQERWESCGPAFDAVVAEDPTGAQAAEAAFAAVLCYQNYYDLAHKGGKDKEGIGQTPKSATGTEKTKGQENLWAKLQPKPLDDMQKSMLTAFSRYVCYIKPPEKRDTDEAKTAYKQYVQVKYARAYTYFEAQQWEQAAIAFRDIALNHPEPSGPGLHAAHLYLEAVNVLGSHAEPPRPECFDGMATDVPKFLGLYCSGTPADGETGELCTMLTSIQCDISRLKAQKLAEKASATADKGDVMASLAMYRQAGDAYMDLWRTRGEKQLAAGQEAQCRGMDEIVYNAARAYQAGRMLMKSVSARKLLQDPTYKLNKTAVAEKALYELGGNYQAIADYDQAATYFEKYAKDTEYKGEHANAALSDAVVLRLGLGQAESALANAKLFGQKFAGGKSREQAAQIGFAVAAHYGEQKAWQKVIEKLGGGQLKMIDAEATPDVRLQAHALLARAHAGLGARGRASAEAEYRQVLALWKEPDKVIAAIEKDGGGSSSGRRLGRALEAVGEAMFTLAEAKREKAEALVFPKYTGKGDGPAVEAYNNKTLQPWFLKKKAAIEEAKAAYSAILELKPTPPPVWVIASGARIGRLWGDFVDQLKGAPVPDSLKQFPDLFDVYTDNLARALAPLTLEARGAFETCLNLSVKHQYFDDYSRTCEIWLAKNTADYTVVDEFRGAPGRVNSALKEHPYPVMIGGEPWVQAPANQAAESKPKAEPAENKTKGEAGKPRAEGAQG